MGLNERTVNLLGVNSDGVVTSTANYGAHVFDERNAGFGRELLANAAASRRWNSTSLGTAPAGPVMPNVQLEPTPKAVGSSEGYASPNREREDG